MEQQENIHYRKVRWTKMKALCTRKNNKINTEKLAIKEKKSVKLNASWQINNIEKAHQSLNGVFEKQVRGWSDLFLNPMSLMF